MAHERAYSRRGGVETGLRTAAVWATVRDLSDRRREQLGRSLRVIDLGGGTGGLAVPLAEQGDRVLVVDPSPDALASLQRRAREAGPGTSGRVTAVQGDADCLPEVVAATLGDEPVDLICFHGTLEVVDDPEAAIAGIAGVLAPGGHLSLVAAQRLAVVLSRALAGQFAQAQEVLTSADGRWGPDDPVPRRFDQEVLVGLLSDHGLTVEQVTGVRLFSDLVPSALVDSEADRVALLELEQAASHDPRFALLGQLGSALHVLARKS